MINKRKKVSRQRGSMTHGYGSKKKHRGAGHRGGRGNAGSGKRGDAKKPSFWKDTHYFGKSGFVKKGQKRVVKAVNIGYLEENLAELLSRGLIMEEKGVYIIDAEKLGFNKILGKGKVTKKFKIKAESMSSKAVEKAKKAGGDAG